MAFEFRLPDIGEGIAEGEIVQWFVSEGGSIREDAPLVSVLTDKANVEIPSPRSGRVTKIHAQVGEKVKVGAVLVTIEETDRAPTAPVVSTSPSPPIAASHAPAPPPPNPAYRSTAPVPSGPSADPRRAAPSDAGGAKRILATPYLRRLATGRGIDLSRVTGTGPGGRIQEADLGGGPPSRATPAPAPTPAHAAPKAPPGAPPGPMKLPASASAPAPGNEFETIAIRGIRRVISERMSASVHTAAHFTYVEEVEVSELVRLRDRMARHVEKSGGTKLSYLPFIIKAVIEGLRVHPWMNARMDDAKAELHVFRSYHIGIATATPEGLIVPVIHHAERKSLNQIAREIQELSERARDGKLGLPELTGGTFTITSLGALGGILATPILNYPEVAILGVHRIQKRPTYLPDGSIGPGMFMNLSVSLDHRVLDGIVGAQFLSVVKTHLEDPHSLFADMA